MKIKIVVSVVTEVEGQEQLHFLQNDDTEALETLWDLAHDEITSRRIIVEEVKTDVEGVCQLCGLPMPKGEEMFKFHGYSCPCPVAAGTVV